MNSLNFPIFNASGVWCSSERELVDLVKSQSDEVVFKTMTVKPRLGNPEPRLFIGRDFSVNSMGLPNLGVDKYCQIAEKILKYKKPMTASIAGFSENEFISLTKKVDKAPFTSIELNFSCPNLESKGIFAYDISLSLRLLAKLRKLTKKKLGVKLPPYVQRGDIKTMAEGLLKHNINFVTLINSFPLGCVIDHKKEIMVIKPNDGIGGLGGSIIKPIALSQVVLFRKYLGGKREIIGVGGINSAEDIYEFILAGTRGVGIGTALLKKGPKIFKKLKLDLHRLLIKKKIRNISDKLGKLKFL